MGRTFASVPTYLVAANALDTVGSEVGMYAMVSGRVEAAHIGLVKGCHGWRTCGNLHRMSQCGLFGKRRAIT